MHQVSFGKELYPCEISAYLESAALVPTSTYTARSHSISSLAEPHLLPRSQPAPSTEAQTQPSDMLEI